MRVESSNVYFTRIVLTHYNYLILNTLTMKTNQIMLRTLNNNIIRQRTDNSFFCATDILVIHNKENNSKKELKEYFELKSTNELINEINMDSNRGNYPYLKNKLYIAVKGNGGGTYMHPYLFLDFCMWISPKFKLQAIKWIYDGLIKNRHLVGDGYRELTDTMKDNLNINDYHDYQNEARMINDFIFDGESNKRNLADEKQLDLLDKLQKADIKLIKQGVKSIYERRNKLKEFLELL